MCIWKDSDLSFITHPKMLLSSFHPKLQSLHGFWIMLWDACHYFLNFFLNAL